MRYVEREKPQSHNFDYSDGYNWSIVCLPILVNLLLCLMYKLNFIIGCIHTNKHGTCRVQYCLGFQAPTGGLGRHALLIRGCL